MVTVERLHELVEALPEAERQTAARVLEALAQSETVSGAAFFTTTPVTTVLRPDAPPVQDIDELRGDFWPDDEGPDDLVRAVQAWRREGDHA